MSDTSRKALFGTLRDAGFDTKAKAERLAIAQAALSSFDNARTVTSFTLLTDNDAARVIAFIRTVRLGRLHQLTPRR